MAISPATGERMAVDIARIYAEAEVTLIGKMASALYEDIDVEEWAAIKLADIRRLRHEVEREVVAPLEALVPPEVEMRLAEIYSRGQDSAVADLRKVLDEADIPVTAGLTRTDEQRIATLVRATTGRLEDAHFRILRQAQDVYRDVVAHATEQVAVGVMTRQEAAQQALNEFANRGVTGFVDRSGRSWSLQSYTEMAIRSSSGQTALEGHVRRLEDNNRDLVIISDHDEECELCRPHEGRVYSISGDHPTFPPLSRAEDDGLFHPNCRHSLGAYIHNLTEPPDPEPDPEGYEERQEQRKIERNIRKWKRREAAAMDDEEREYSRNYRAKWQDEMRGFIDKTGRRRKYEREQTTRAW